MLLRFVFRVLFGVGVLGLVSCTHVHMANVEDGRQGYYISCKGWSNSWTSCLVKAGRVCGVRGFEKLHDDEYDRTLVVACR